MFRDFSNTESSQVNNIGNILKAARKFVGANQSMVAKAIGCSQSALSKMEHESLVPSAPQWFAFCRAVGVPSDCLMKGVIDRSLAAEIPPEFTWDGPSSKDSNLSDERLPQKRNRTRGLTKKHSCYAGHKVKYLLPFFSFMGKNLGEQGIEQFCRDKKIGFDFFCDCDNQFNMRLLFELIDYLQDNHSMDEKAIAAIAQEILDPDKHGPIHRDYIQARAAVDILKVYEQKQKFYQVDVEFKLETCSSRRVVVSFESRPYVDIFLREASENAKTFLRLYRKHILYFLSAYSDDSLDSVNYLDLESSSSDKDFYELNLKR